MFINLFYNILAVFLMMLPGFIAIKKKLFQESALIIFSKVIVSIFYPALIFSFIVSNFTFNTIIDSWQLPVSIFIITVVGFSVGLIYQLFKKSDNIINKKSVLFQFTFNNYSFMPLAIIANIYDERYMAALIFGTLGAEIAIWTIGMFILNSDENKFSLSNLKHLLSPPLLGIYVALIFLFILKISSSDYATLISKYQLINYFNTTLYNIGQATIPLSMLMVGGRIATINFATLKLPEIWIITLFRLIVIPFVAIVVLTGLFKTHIFFNVMLIVAVMPNSAASLVLGELYGANQQIMGGTVLITTILSILTIPVWLSLLHIS